MNQLCARLDIEVPIIQSGMGGFPGPNLAAAVSEAGGLGILAALLVPPDVLRRQIDDVRRRTDRSFGVNIWLHEELAPPRRPEKLDAGILGRSLGWSTG